MGRSQIIEKLGAQRNIKEMEKKRNEMRKRLFEAQDGVDGRKEELLQDIEKKANPAIYSRRIIYHKVEGGLE